MAESSEEKRVAELQTALSRAVLGHRTASAWFGLCTNFIYAVGVGVAAKASFDLWLCFRLK